MQTFLVPVDFSEASDNALHYAARLATLFKAKLVLFHAYMLPTPVSEVPYVMITADELQKENEKLIQNAASKIKEQYQVETSCIVRIGIASDEVKAITKEQSIDLVVMGMKGAGGFEKIIGSTTTNVLRKVSTPVLIVPHDASFRPINIITYPSDFSYPVKASLYNALFEIAKQYRSHIHILNIQTSHSSREADTIAGKMALQTLFEGFTHSFFSREDASVTHGISKYLGESNSDLLVMVAHKHSFFERIFSQSHTSAMAYETHIPMLVLPEH
jgi:nucleotide-binding universal stress UspA family protein